ncbi:uroporphyrinogen-III C-methyltransferase [Sulfurihydrogenibium sp.]|uniref:uroporphyrinogen-III C-methyltransferase n=1 Tax=Sulfurihydrogenibium sp. TaxID=2053621 RepID=UPI002603966C|nr:uroporphyrinogen-III C-methyltransferase [Sulfurihydrogenibium sp.]
MRKGRVYLIGCGTGDPELLTIKALKIFEKLDIALIDHLVSDEIVELLPKKTKLMYVGKQQKKTSIKQEDINKILLEFAKSGLTVGRLKSGDPYIFGRGGEETLFLLDNGIEVEVIPGVSSSTVAPLYAGIPLVMRGFSSSFSVVSAYNAGNKFNRNWLHFLKEKNHTVVVLMGLTKSRQIKEEALNIGVSKDIPVAIISNASRKNQKVIITNLDKLDEDSKNVEKPAVLVFGEVVNLHKKLQIYKNQTSLKTFGEMVWKS